ncbi:MAG TPA: hypothetical protein VMV46_13120 [Thermoanaerobaculia bacterium]|nr:hypothetical protein [Thermoanaerobaculia bacterium]
MTTTAKTHAIPGIPRRRDLAIAAVALAVLLAAPALASPGAAAAADVERSTSPAGAETWLLLVNGDDSELHHGNLRLAAESLARIGYRADRTIVLQPAGTAPAGLAAADGATVLPATLDGWQAAIDHLRAQTRGERPELLVYLTGHGKRKGGQSVLLLDRGVLAADRLADDLATLDLERLVVIADQCFSGGFADPFADWQGVDLTVVSSTDDSSTTSCPSFVHPFWRAATDPSKDLDRDGRVSVEEAVDAVRALIRRIPEGAVSAREWKELSRPQILRTADCGDCPTAFLSL